MLPDAGIYGDVNIVTFEDFRLSKVESVLYSGISNFLFVR